MKLIFILCLVVTFIPTSQPYPYSVDVNVGQINWYGPQQWINAYYYEMWGEGLTGIDITNCSNGDVIVLAQSQNTEHRIEYSMAMRVNNQGEVLWSHLYHRTWAIAVLQRSDNHYFIVGKHSETPTNILFITCIDGLNGNILWERNHTLSLYRSWSTATATNDDGVLVVCSTDTYSGPTQNRTWNGLRFDTNGDLLWNKTYAHYIPNSQVAVTNCRDGTFLLVGDESNQLVAYRLESDGSVRWTQIYDDPAAYDVVESSTSGFLILGQQVFRINDEGNQLWNNTYWQLNDGGSIVACHEGFLVSGFGPDPSPFIPSGSINAVRINNDGVILWQWSHGTGDKYGIGFEAGIVSEEGGFFLTGGIFAFGHDSALLVRLPDVPLPTQMIMQLSFNSYVWVTALLLMISILLLLFLIRRQSTSERLREVYERFFVGNIILYSGLLPFWLYLWSIGPVYPIIRGSIYSLNLIWNFFPLLQTILPTLSGLLFFIIGIGLAIIYQGLKFTYSIKPLFQQEKPIRQPRIKISYPITAILLCLFGMVIVYSQGWSTSWTWYLYGYHLFLVFPIILLGYLTAAGFPTLLLFLYLERKETHRS
ncbi:MAG: hypothetical protein Q6364_09450 [Candidatus Hermodarchaeota archaeon]|nr:hypothetical protein [Candidatus Hermodarchaeota archaeon]